MTQVTVDAELLAKLHGLRDSIVFFDEQGHVLGRFEPDPASTRPNDLEAGISRDELRHRAENFQGKPLSELLAEWEKRK
jgi:hypothetical protein